MDTNTNDILSISIKINDTLYYQLSSVPINTETELAAWKQRYMQVIDNISLRTLSSFK